MSAEKKSAFINVDELMPKVSLQQVAEFYGVALPELRRARGETRSACFLALCPREGKTGDRVLAIQEEDPNKRWHCHQYGCGMGGNLLGLMDLLKPGAAMNGKPRGDRFKELAADLRAIVSGESAPPTPPFQPPSPKSPCNQESHGTDETAHNIPLLLSPNEAARGLMDLPDDFILPDALDRLPPEASAYFRSRPFLTSEVCREWGLGYLPRSAGASRRGGTMRGRLVYTYKDEQGMTLGYFGRDPRFENEHKVWLASGRKDKEPIKTRFPSGFHRSLELYGQDRLQSVEGHERINAHGFFVIVEGPNDAIRLWTLGAPAVALCGNRITTKQAEKAARLARETGARFIALMLDADQEGMEGARQTIAELALRVPTRLLWTGDSHDGRFRERQPESLTAEEWVAIRES